MKKIVLGAGLLLAASAAAAQLAPPVQAQPRDGIQTRAEVVDRTRAMFARADANRDGFITAEEGRAVRGQVRQRVARAGRAAGNGMMFERLDTNRDNVISRDEWARMQEMRSQRVTRRGEAAGLGGQQRMMRRGGAGGAMLRQADANRDGRISLAEAEAAALQRFANVDLNRDGRVTREERQSARRILWQRRNEGVREAPVR